MNRIDEIKRVSIHVMGSAWTERNKIQDNVYKRAVYYAVCRELSDSGLSIIGKSVGKDHATVLHGLKIFYEEMNGSAEYSNYIMDYWKIKRICKKNFEIYFLSNETPKERMTHIILNQREYISKLESILENIPQYIKIKYAS